MKLVKSLAIIVTCFTIFGTIGNNSASAADFNLSAVLDNFGDTLNGTYSYSGDAIPQGDTENISSFSISIDKNGTPVETFNTGNSFASLGNSALGYQLGFVNQTTNDVISLEFGSNFTGAGNITTGSNYSLNSLVPPGGFFNSGSSTPVITQSVPEPSSIPGILALGAGLFAMKLKKKQKAKLLPNSQLDYPTIAFSPTN